MNNVFMVAAAGLFGFSRRAGSFEMVMLGRLLAGVNAGMGGRRLALPVHSYSSAYSHFVFAK